MRKSKAESALDAMANQKAKKENSTTIDEEALCQDPTAHWSYQPAKVYNIPDRGSRDLTLLWSY